VVTASLVEPVPAVEVVVASVVVASVAGAVEVGAVDESAVVALVELVALAVELPASVVVSSSPHPTRSEATVRVETREVLRIATGRGTV
jgi:hypothetical protein